MRQHNFSMAMAPWFCAGLAALLVAGLFYGGAQPVAVGLLAEPWDKLAHASLFAVIAGLLALSRPGLTWRWSLVCLLVTMTVGAMDELHQHFLPGRSADWSDLAADTFGAGLSVLLLKLMNIRLYRERAVELKEVS